MENLQYHFRIYKNGFFVSIKYIIAIFYAILALFPFAWVILNSFKTNEEIYTSPFKLPETFDFLNYLEVWENTKIGTYFYNSTLISFTVVFILALIASMASYYISRVRPSVGLYTYFTLGIMIPIHAMLIPTFIMLRAVDLLNNRIGLAVVYCAVNLSLSIFILVGFMKGIQKEMEEAAEIDGASIYRTFFSIILPIAKPGIATIVTLSFLNAWNDFLYAQVLISNPLFNTITQGIQNLRGQYVTDFGLLSAGMVFMIVPATVFYILFQEHVVKGLTAGAVKG